MCIHLICATHCPSLKFKKGKNTSFTEHWNTQVPRAPWQQAASVLSASASKFWHYTSTRSARSIQLPMHVLSRITPAAKPARFVDLGGSEQKKSTPSWFQLCSEQSGGSFRLPVAVLSTWPRGDPGNSFRCCQRKLFSFWTGDVRARSSCFTKYVKSSLVSRCALLRDWRSRVVFRGWKSRSNMMPSRGSVRSMCPEALRWKFLAFLWMSVFALSDVMCQETRTSECYYGKPDNVTGCLCDPGFSGTSCNRCARRSR